MKLSTIRVATTSDLRGVPALYRHLNSDDPLPDPLAAKPACRDRPKADLTRRCKSAGRGTRLSRNVRQPNHVLADEIADHKAERRPATHEEWLAATKHDEVEGDPILIDETKVAQGSRQVWSANVHLPNALSLQHTPRRLEVVSTGGALGPLDVSEHDTTPTSAGCATPSRIRVPPRPTRDGRRPNSA